MKMATNAPKLWCSINRIIKIQKTPQKGGVL